MRLEGTYTRKRKFIFETARNFVRISLLASKILICLKVLYSNYLIKFDACLRSRSRNSENSDEVSRKSMKSLAN